MAHQIQAGCARDDVAIRETLRPFGARGVTVGGFLLVPVSPDLLGAIGNRRRAHPSDICSLTVGLSDLLLGLSRRQPVVYIFTEYFGGDGEQGAVLWSRGQVVLDRVSSDIGPINDALEALGVTPMPESDAFDALGLGQHRETDDWLEIAAPV